MNLFPSYVRTIRTRELVSVRIVLACSQVLSAPLTAGEATWTKVSLEWQIKCGTGSGLYVHVFVGFKISLAGRYYATIRAHKSTSISLVHVCRWIAFKFWRHYDASTLDGVNGISQFRECLVGFQMFINATKRRDIEAPGHWTTT